MEGRQKNFARFTSDTISSGLFPYTWKLSLRRRSNRAAAKDMRTPTSLHKHKNEENYDINVSDVTDGSYFRYVYVESCAGDACSSYGRRRAVSAAARQDASGAGIEVRLLEVTTSLSDLLFHVWRTMRATSGLNTCVVALQDPQTLCSLPYVTITEDGR